MSHSARVKSASSTEKKGMQPRSPIHEARLFSLGRSRWPPLPRGWTQTPGQQRDVQCTRHPKEKRSLIGRLPLYKYKTPAVHEKNVIAKRGTIQHSVSDDIVRLRDAP